MKLYFEQLRMPKELLDQTHRKRVDMLYDDLMAIFDHITNTEDVAECYFAKVLTKTYEKCATISGLCT